MNKVVKKKDHCFWCGRKDGVVREIEVQFKDEIFLITAPWCNWIKDGNDRICSPYSFEERQRKYIKDHWTKRDAYERMDSGIRDLVIECNTAGIPTMFSCDGHGRDGYILFYSLIDAANAEALFKKKWPHGDQFPVSILKQRYIGTMYEVTIPAVLLVGSPRKTPKERQRTK